MSIMHVMIHEHHIQTGVSLWANDCCPIVHRKWTLVFIISMLQCIAKWLVTSIWLWRLDYGAILLVKWAATERLKCNSPHTQCFTPSKRQRIRRAGYAYTCSCPCGRSAVNYKTIVDCWNICAGRLIHYLSKTWAGSLASLKDVAMLVFWSSASLLKVRALSIISQIPQMRRIHPSHPSLSTISRSSQHCLPVPIAICCKVWIFSRHL